MATKAERKARHNKPKAVVDDPLVLVRPLSGGTHFTNSFGGLIPALPQFNQPPKQVRPNRASRRRK